MTPGADTVLRITGGSSQALEEPRHRAVQSPHVRASLLWLFSLLLVAVACSHRLPRYPRANLVSSAELASVPALTFDQLRAGSVPVGDRFHIDAYVVTYSYCPPCPPRHDCKTCKQLETILYLSDVPSAPPGQLMLLGIVLGRYDPFPFLTSEKRRFEIGAPVQVRDSDSAPLEYLAPAWRYAPLR